MNREACTFFSGAFAALAYAHAAYAVATSRGIISEPVFMGRRWGVGYMWSEAAVYAAVSGALGYAGWLAGRARRDDSPTHELPPESVPTAVPAASRAPSI